MKIISIRCILFFTAIACTVCCNVKDYRVVISRNQASDAIGSNLDRLYADSLMVFFEQGFNQTPVKIDVGGEVLFEGEITTHDDIELADVKNIGYNKEVEDFKLSIDNGEYIPIKIDTTYKFVAISYFIDTVYVDYMKFYPVYE